MITRFLYLFQFLFASNDCSPRLPIEDWMSWLNFVVKSDSKLAAAKTSAIVVYVTGRVHGDFL